MKREGRGVSERAFCTFCIGAVDASRIRGHLRRCTDRRLDVEAAGVGVREVRSFLLLLKIAGLPEAWVALEVHETTLFEDVLIFMHRLWFPEVKGPGMVTPACRRWKKLLREAGDRLGEYPVGEFFQVKDRFRFSVVPDHAALAVEVEVFAYGKAAVRNLPIDIVAYPVGMDRGAKPISERCPWLLRAH